MASFSWRQKLTLQTSENYVAVLNEEYQPPVEIARFKGFGITIEVRSDDCGKFGNKCSPVYARVLDKDGNETAQIVLTKDVPKTTSDIIWYRMPSPPLKIGTAIIKLVSSKSTTEKKAGFDVSVWQSILICWINLHES